MPDANPSAASASNPLDNAHYKRLIRRDKRCARQQLSSQNKQRVSGLVVRRLSASPELLRAKRVALYWPMPEELDITPLLSVVRQKTWYLPVVSGRDMDFYPVPARPKLVLNHFGIHEPVLPAISPAKPWQLDLLLVPLVSFDRHRQRLGMGGGFYDRWLADANASFRRPRLLGVAFECQRYASNLPAEPWDQPMDAIVTEKGWYR